MELFYAMLVPFLMLAAALWGTFRRVDLWGALVAGAGEGLKVTAGIVPPLVALLSAVYMLRASGALELLGQVLEPVLSAVGIPVETIGLLLVRPVSGSAALGVGAELIEMLGSTETTFYTVAVYFGAAKIARTRYAIPAALCGDVVGFLAASWAVRLIFGY